MATGIEKVSGVTLPDHQVEFGKRTHGIIDQITTHIRSLRSFNSAVAENFFGRQSPPMGPRSPAHSVTFNEGGDLYRVEWASGEVMGSGFSSNVSLIRSHLGLTKFDLTEATGQWRKIEEMADLDSHILVDAAGQFLDFTGGNIKLRSGFVLDVSDKNPPSWKTARPTSILVDRDAIESLSNAFPGICPILSYGTEWPSFRRQS